MHSVPSEDLALIAGRLEKIWPCNQKFLITGGTGFFGRWLVETIAYLENKLQSNNTISIVTRQSVESVISKIPVLEKSYFQIRRSAVQDLTHFTGDLDYIIDAASDVSLAKSDTNSEIELRNYVQGTKNLLHIAKQKNIKKYLYISSGGVYPASEASHLESDLVSNSFPDQIKEYRESKIAAESLVIQASNESHLPFNIVRCFSFLGPYADPKMAVMEFIHQKIQEKKIQVHSPDVIRSYMYPVDLVVGLFEVLLKAKSSVVFNLGSDQPVRLGDLVSQIEQVVNFPVGESLPATPNLSLAGKCYLPNIDLIRKELQFNMQIQLSEALRKTLDFYKNRKSV